MTPRLISITGPESSGKTALAHELGVRLKNAVVVEEYARIYLDSQPPGFRYDLKDLHLIARKQREMIELARKDSRYSSVICDTDYLVLHIWMLEAFGQSSPEIEAWCAQGDFGIHLLCQPDLVWEPDPLRENPFDRDRIFNRYLEELTRFNLPYRIVSGTGAQRINNALDHLHRALDNSLP